MKTKVILVLAAIAFLSLAAGWSSRAQSSSRKWEYKVLTVYGYPDPPAPNLNQFNELGENGWELVMVLPEDSVLANKRQTKIGYYFKRRI